MISEAERQKYAEIWQHDRYDEVSPGELAIDMFKQIAEPKPGQRVLDIGAGAGRGSRALKKLGLQVRAFDLTNEAWDDDTIPLTTGCFWHGLPNGPFDYGYCCDVMEHIPTQFVGLCLDHALTVCRRAFFTVSFRPDVGGAVIRKPLHLTVQPFVWWRDTLRDLGTVYEARDRIGEGIFYVGR